MAHFRFVLSELQRKLTAEADKLYLQDLIIQRSHVGLDENQFASLNKRIGRVHRQLQRYYYPGVLGTDEEIEQASLDEMKRRHEERFGVKWDTEEAENIDLVVREMTRRQRRQRQGG